MHAVLRAQLHVHLRVLGVPAFQMRDVLDTPRDGLDTPLDVLGTLHAVLDTPREPFRQRRMFEMMCTQSFGLGFGVEGLGVRVEGDDVHAVLRAQLHVHLRVFVVPDVFRVESK